MTVFSVSLVMGEQTTIPFDPILDEEPKDVPEIGQRSAPDIVIAHIDWEANSLILPDEILDAVISYELWTENTCITQTTDASDLITYLSALDCGLATIIINTHNYYKLIGTYTPVNN